MGCESLDCVMRYVALLLVVVLMAPLSSALPIPELPKIEAEWVIVEEDGWTNEEWENLRDKGLEPLRQISDTEVSCLSICPIIKSFFCPFCKFIRRLTDEKWNNDLCNF